MAAPAIGLNTWVWNNNLKSTFLLAAFPFLFLFMTWAFFAAVDHMALSQQLGLPYYRNPVRAGWYGLVTYGPFVALGVGLWFVVAFLFHQAMINAATGAQPVYRKEAPEIYNLLENLCISRGIVMPNLYIIPSPALNAYASGLKETDFSITLTQGLIDTLSKEELETVIAHELTHIMNRDVRLLVISVIFVGILSFASEATYRILINSNRRRYSYHRDRDRGGAAMIMIVAFVILGIGYCLSLLIRFTLSRKREYLADAGAVQLTKNASALIRALQKISGHSNLPAPDEVKQMFIDSDQHFLGMFATHPPIPKRIEALQMMGGIVEELPPPKTQPMPWDNQPPSPW